MPYRYGRRSGYKHSRNRPVGRDYRGKPNTKWRHLCRDPEWAQVNQGLHTRQNDAVGTARYRRCLGFERMYHRMKHQVRPVKDQGAWCRRSFICEVKIEWKEMPKFYLWISSWSNPISKKYLG